MNEDVVSMPITKNYRILTYDNRNKVKREITVMTYISEEEESHIDKGETLLLTRGDRHLTVEVRRVYCYGEVDFSTGSDDFNQIDTFSFLDYLTGFTGLPIYANYDYKTHTCRIPEHKLYWAETWSPAIVAQYAHGCLGKPQRIVLFKMTPKI